MSASAARVIDLEAYRRRRKAREQSPSAPVVVFFWVPVWVHVPVPVWTAI